MTANLVNEIAAALPPLQGERDVIVPGEQSVKDIMKEVLESHQVFAPDYDRIAEFFASDGDPLRSLFSFCKEYLPYKAEDGNDQTSRSPIAIIMLADSWGVDCKHYSGWIGGVIDACNRAGYTNYDWAYRFVSYNPLDESKEHVFVVVNPGADEIWIDPAPIEHDGHFTTRSFNDRKIFPFYKTDKKPNMSLNRISGCCGDGNAQGETMGAMSYWLPATDDTYLPVDELPYEQLPIKSTFQPITIPDEYLPFEPIFQMVEPVTADLGPSVYYDPGAILQAPVTADPAVPTFDSSQLNRIESVNTPFIADYPMVTGEVPLTLPTIQDIKESLGTSTILNLTPTGMATISPASTTEPAGTLNAGFDIGAFIKANPVPVILIGGAAVIGGLYLIKKSRKKKRV